MATDAMASMRELLMGLEELSDQETEDLIFGLGQVSRVVEGSRADSEKVRDTILLHAAGPIAKLVAKDLTRNPKALKLVVQTYLTSPDPMKEYREIAAFDFMEAVARAFPDEFTSEYTMETEEVPEGLLDLSGKKRKKRRKRLRRIGKYVAIGAAAVGAVALGVATGGAAVPAIAAVGGTAFSMKQQKKAVDMQKKAIKRAEREAAAQAEQIAKTMVVPPDPGQIAPTTSAALTAAQEHPAIQGSPVAQGTVAAEQKLVEEVIPQAMATVAAAEICGKSVEELSKEYGIPEEEIKKVRVEKCREVAAGSPPPAETPGWVLPAAVGGGVLILGLVAGQSR